MFFGGLFAAYFTHPRRQRRLAAPGHPPRHRPRRRCSPSSSSRRASPSTRPSEPATAPPAAGRWRRFALGVIFLANLAAEWASNDFSVSTNAYGSMLLPADGLPRPARHRRPRAPRHRRAASDPDVPSLGPRPSPGHRLLLALRRRRVGRPLRHHLPGAMTARSGGGRRLLTAGGVGACVAVGVLAFVASFATAQSATNDGADNPELVAAGRALYQTGCSSCHGEDATGSDQVPSLVGVGAAAADFQLRTGRMPLAVIGEQAVRKQPAYSDDEIKALVAYVASLGPGPAIPTVDVATADVVQGGDLFRANCAACHNAAGVGGALSYGQSRAVAAVGDADRGGRGDAHRAWSDARVRRGHVHRPAGHRHRGLRDRRPAAPGQPRWVRLSAATGRCPRASWPGRSGSSDRRRRRCAGSCGGSGVAMPEHDQQDQQDQQDQVPSTGCR